MCSNDPNRHSDRALEAIGLGEVSELPDGALLYTNQKGQVFRLQLIGYDGMYALHEVNQHGRRTWLTQGTFTWCRHLAQK